MKSLINKLKRLILKIFRKKQTLEQVGLAKIFRKQISDIKNNNYSENINLEWSIFSQFNEDGLINEACRRLFEFDNKLEKKAIEFGSGGYSSNIGLLSATFNLKCKFIDGSKKQLKIIRDLLSITLKLIPEAKKNLIFINKYIDEFNIKKEIKDLLGEDRPTVASVDIDSFDEIIIKELMLLNIPLIIAEYNACFGADRTISFHTRKISHNMGKTIKNSEFPIFGISYQKLIDLAETNNYFCWKVEKSGINMILINKKYLNLFLDIEDSFRKSVIYNYIFSELELDNLINKKKYNL